MFELTCNCIATLFNIGSTGAQFGARQTILETGTNDHAMIFTLSDTNYFRSDFWCSKPFVKYWCQNSAFFLPSEVERRTNDRTSDVWWHPYFCLPHGPFYMFFEGIFTGRKLSSSLAFSQCQFTAQLVKAEVVLTLLVWWIVKESHKLSSSSLNFVFVLTIHLNQFLKTFLTFGF